MEIPCGLDAARRPYSLRGDMLEELRRNREMKTWICGIFLLLGSLLGGCSNPCEVLFARCSRCADRIQEDRCKSTSAFNHWGACGILLDEFSKQNVCQDGSSP